MLLIRESLLIHKDNLPLNRNIASVPLKLPFTSFIVIESALIKELMK